MGKKDSIITKYRPGVLSDVKGQARVVKEITRLVESADIYNYNYLITGSYGTGKTTLARIMAKIVLCEGRESNDLNPCEECAACAEVNAGGSMRGYIELDAGSSGGIDEIREIIQLASQHPGNTSGWKVFVIDECHRLSGPAASAMLKVLEEKLSVVFLMVTTDPQKLISTVKSRLKPLELEKPSAEQIMLLLEKVAFDEGIKFPSEESKGKVLTRIADRTAPHIRDSLISLGDLKIRFTSESGTVRVKEALEYYTSDSSTWFDIMRLISQSVTDPGAYDKVLSELIDKSEQKPESLLMGFAKLVSQKALGRLQVTEGLTQMECRGLFWIVWKALKSLGVFKTFAREVTVFALCEAAQAKEDGTLGGLNQFAGEMLDVQRRSQKLLDSMKTMGDKMTAQRDTIERMFPKKQSEDTTGFDTENYE